MDPLSAMIMAAGSLASSGLSFFGAHQAQQQQAFSAGGGYLPSLAANAAKIGVSPLALLGYHAPSVGNIVGDPGGVSGAGEALARMKDPHTVAMEGLQEKLGQSEVLKRQTEISTLQLAQAKDRYILDKLMDPTNPMLPPDLRNDWVKMGGSFFDSFANSLSRIGASVSAGAKNIWDSANTNRWTSPYVNSVTDALTR